MSDAIVTEMFNAGKSYGQIAEELRTTRNAIAGRCRRLGLQRKPERDPNDMRDLAILADLDAGHTRADTARHHGVSLTYLQRLTSEARAKA